MRSDFEFELLASGFEFLEAPRVDGDGRLYFTDTTAIYRLLPDGTIEPVVQHEASGIVLHADGGLVVSSGARLIYVGRDHRSTCLFSLDGPGELNDITTDPSGRVLCGSIRPTAGDAGGRALGDAWRVDGVGRATRLYGDVEFSNGMGFSRDGMTLFHADSHRREVIVHAVSSSGSVSQRTRLSTSSHPGMPDGLAIDEEDCAWVAMYGGGCVVCLDAQGATKQIVPIPATRVTSLCFAGDDRRDLIVVTCDNTRDAALGGSIFRTRVSTPGVTIPLAEV